MSTVSSTTTSATNPNSTLSQQDFLNLLVTQLSSQDPLNPESDTDFAAQLAQFSALQTAQSTQGTMASLQAEDLIGSTVTVQTTSNTTQSGVVTGVEMNSGTPSILVGGAPYTLSQILSVQQTANSTSTPN
jgi:flagellar basal-body rod modification protein FlgD